MFGPLLSAVGATIVPLSVTEESGLDPWIKWITDDLYFQVGVGSLIVGILWTSIGVIWPTREAEKLRVKMKADEADVSNKVAQARVKASEGIVHQLSPIIHDLGNLIDSRQMNHGGTLIDRCLHAVTQVIGVEDVRACLYYLDQVESDEASSTDILNALLVRMPQVGRHDPPRPEFIRGEGAHADGMFDVIDSGKPRLIPDTAVDSGVLDCEGKPYKTFMNVAVKFKTEEMGILSVDAPVAGSLTNNHMLLAEMIANILAIGMRREKKRNSAKVPSPGPAVVDGPANPAAEGIA